MSDEKLEPGMSESKSLRADALRDRIAAVIDREVDGLWEPLAVADAVIAELNLTEDSGVIVGCAHE